MNASVLRQPLFRISSYCVLAVSVVLPCIAQESDFAVELMDLRAGYAALTPEAQETRSGEVSFLVGASSATIDIAIMSNIGGMATSIAAPGGQTNIDPQNVDQYGGAYFGYQVGVNPDPGCLWYPSLCNPGFHYVYTFDSQGPGDYVVSFVAPEGMGGENNGLVLVQFQTDSTIAAGAIVVPDEVQAGGQVTITAFAFDDAIAITNATASARVHDPVTDAYTAPIALFDDGQGVDDLANDGLYSGTFVPTPGNMGKFDVLTEITGSGGVFSRQAPASFEVFDPPAVFVANPTVTFTDWDVDDPDPDTLIDLITVGINVDVALAGKYRLTVILREITSGQDVVLQSGDFSFSTGNNQSIFADLDAADVLDLIVPGSTVQFAFLQAELTYYGVLGLDSALVSDRYEETGQTTSAVYSLARFDRPDVTTTGTVNISTTGTPISALNVDIEMYVVVDGTYEYSVNLEDSCDGYIMTLVGTQEFTGGVVSGEVVAQELNLALPGPAIGANGIDGPYEVRDLVMYGPASYLMDDFIETSAYAANTFDSYLPPPDCNGNQTPDLCDIRDQTSLDCNFDLVPDECCSGDLDFDGFVNSLDGGLLQSQYGCLATAGGCGLCDRSDLDGDGTVNPVDLGLWQALPQGPCGGLSPFGGGGPGDGGSPLTGMWEITIKDVAFEVQPAGGGRPIDVLEANTAYEIHYVAEHATTNGFALFAVTGSDQAGIESASAPRVGDWAQAGRLHFMDRRGDRRERRRAYGYSDEYHRNQQVTNNFYPYGSGRMAGPRGHLCSFTTAGAGELNLHLYLWMIDEAEQTLVIMESRVVAIVR